MKHMRKAAIGGGIALAAFGIVSQDVSACYEGNMPDWCYETPQTTEPETTVPETTQPEETVPPTTEEVPETTVVVETTEVAPTTTLEEVIIVDTLPPTTEAAPTTIVVSGEPQETNAPNQLPATGSNQNDQIAFGLAALVVGGILTAVATRRRSA